MKILKDFRYMAVKADSDGFSFRILYKYGKTFCKSLNCLFDKKEDAESVTCYLQLWIDQGGMVLFTNGEDCVGMITGLDGSKMKDCPVQLSSQLIHVIQTGGFCPVQMVAYLLNVQPRAIEYHISRRKLTCKTAGRLKLVNIKEVYDSMRVMSARESLQKEYDDLCERIEGCRDEFSRYEQLLPALRMLYFVMHKNASCSRNGKIFQRCLEGKGFSKISKEVDLSEERIRQIFSEQMASAKKQLCLMALHVFKQSSLIARNALLEQEIARLRIETKLVRVEHAFDLKPDKETRQWTQLVCRLLHTPMNELGFSTRTYNVLRSMGVENVLQIGRLSLVALANTPNSGKKTISEVTEFCQKYRLERLSNPLYLKYVEEVGRDLEKDELDNIEAFGFSLDDDGSIWLPDRTSVTEVIEQIKDMARSGYDMNNIVNMDETIAGICSLSFPEEAADDDVATGVEDTFNYD